MHSWHVADDGRPHALWDSTVWLYCITVLYNCTVYCTVTLSTSSWAWSAYCIPSVHCMTTSLLAEHHEHGCSVQFSIYSSVYTVQLYSTVYSSVYSVPFPFFTCTVYSSIIHMFLARTQVDLHASSYCWCWCYCTTDTVTSPPLGTQACVISACEEHDVLILYYCTTVCRLGFPTVVKLRTVVQ